MKARAKAAVRLRLRRIARPPGQQVLHQEGEDAPAVSRRPGARARPAVPARRRAAVRRRAATGRPPAAPTSSAPAAGASSSTATPCQRSPLPASTRQHSAVHSDRRPAGAVPGERERRLGVLEQQERPAAVQQDRLAGGQEPRLRLRRGESRNRRQGSCGHPVEELLVERDVGVDERGVAGRRGLAGEARPEIGVGRRRAWSRPAPRRRQRERAARRRRRRPARPCRRSPSRSPAGPAARASSMTSGAFSHQIDGTTIQSARPHQPDDVGAVVGSEVLRDRRRRAASSRREVVRGNSRPPSRARRGARPDVSPRPAGARRRRAAPARPCAGAIVPKKAKRSRRVRARLAAAGLGIAGDGVRHHVDAVGVEAPGHEAVAQEGARRDEAVDAGRARRAGARAGARGAPPRAPESSAGRRRAARRGSGRPRRSSAAGPRSGRSAGSRAASARSGRRGASRRIAGTISAPIRSSPCRCTTSGRSRRRAPAERRIDPGVAVEPRHREAVVGPGVEHDVVAVGAEAARLRPLAAAARWRPPGAGSCMSARASSARARSCATISVPPGVQSGWSCATWRMLSPLMADPLRRKG